MAKEKRKQSTGKCEYCGESYGKGGMKRHLGSCKARKTAIEAQSKKSKAKPKGAFHIVVEGGPLFWLHLETPADATLKKLDQYLRDIWLECCGHMSQFTIDGQGYSVHPMAEFGDKGMNMALAKVLTVGSQFEHEYDFGTTTHLTLRVLDKREGVIAKDIKLMARNDPLDILCQNCEKVQATEVCTFCIWDGEEAWLCEDCMTKHKCYVDEGDDYMFLPVVNSPRVGMCGYTG